MNERARVYEGAVKFLFKNRSYLTLPPCNCPRQDLCSKTIIGNLAAGIATADQQAVAAAHLMHEVAEQMEQATVEGVADIPGNDVGAVIQMLKAMGARNVVALGPDGSTVGTPPPAEDVMAERLVPPAVRESIALYNDSHIDPGDFLRAVLESNLSQAVNKADSRNLMILPAITAYVYRNVVREAQGSTEKVAAWLGERVQTQ